MSRIKLYALLGVLLFVVGLRAQSYFCSSAKPASSLSSGTRSDPYRPQGPRRDEPQQSDPHKDRLAEFAGFYAAHAIWCVSDDEILVPIVAWEDAAGERNLERIEGENPDLANEAMDRLDQNPAGAVLGVVVVDGFITISGVKCDALLIRARQFTAPEASLSFTIPYRTKTDGGFGVYPPLLDRSGGVLTGWTTSSKSGPEIDVFLRGIKSHEKGYAVWEARAIK